MARRLVTAVGKMMTATRLKLSGDGGVLVVGLNGRVRAVAAGGFWRSYRPLVVG